jgi:hypothetical protein
MRAADVPFCWAGIRQPRMMSRSHQCGEPRLLEMSVGGQSLRDLLSFHNDKRNAVGDHQLGEENISKCSEPIRNPPPPSSGEGVFRFLDRFLRLLRERTLPRAELPAGVPARNSARRSVDIWSINDRWRRSRFLTLPEQQTASRANQAVRSPITLWAGDTSYCLPAGNQCFGNRREYRR